MNTTKHINGGGYCYQHCYIRTDYETPVENTPSFSQIEKEYCTEHGLEKSDQKVFFAQYITEFDVSEPTEWWFTIKDDEYDLSKLKAQERRNVKIFNKYCYAKQINASEYETELFECYKASFSAYPEKYRPNKFSTKSFHNSITEWSNNSQYRIYASFSNDENLLIGFTVAEKNGKAVKLVSQKTNPFYEKYNSNASLIDFVLTKYNEQLKTGNCIFTNGSRSIKHETNFNAYLEKYFGFRKAYAKLRVVYKFPFGIIVKLLKPFRKLFEHTKNPLLYNLYCVLKMDSYSTK